MISVIIPTYKSPEALDLCLRSAIEGQEKENELIAIVDGYYNLNKYILDKYEDHISILDLEENQGLSTATNLGVYNASNENVLIVNDDNVFPDKWDTRLEELGEMKGRVCAPNQIEPTPSMFHQFVIQDLGRDPKTFDLERFWEYSKEVSKELVDDSGSTLPIYMNRLDFLTVGGWDDKYELGMVADWDFFLKCNLAGYKLIRDYNLSFYHFVSLTVNDKEKELSRQQSEQRGHEYARYKWGNYINTNPFTNLKTI